jgi:hypothetical protein
MGGRTGSRSSAAKPSRGPGKRPMTRLGAQEEASARALITRRVTLEFDEFGWESFEAEAEREGEAVEELLARAFSYFDLELRRARAAVLAPRFKPDGLGTPREVRLEHARGCWESLEREGERQRIPLERLLEHAGLLYLADADSGRVADRVLDRPDPRPRRSRRSQL